MWENLLVLNKISVVLRGVNLDGTWPLEHFTLSTGDETFHGINSCITFASFELQDLETPNPFVKSHCKLPKPRVTGVCFSSRIKWSCIFYKCLHLFGNRLKVTICLIFITLGIGWTTGFWALYGKKRPCCKMLFIFVHTESNKTSFVWGSLSS